MPFKVSKVISNITSGRREIYSLDCSPSHPSISHLPPPLVILENLSPLETENQIIMNVDTDLLEDPDSDGPSG